MRAVWVGVPDALENGNLALVVQVLQGAHGGVKADIVVEAEHLLVGHADGGAVVGIERIAVGDQGVYGVVAARELQNHQDGIFLG